MQIMSECDWYLTTCCWKQMDFGTPDRQSCRYSWMLPAIELELLFHLAHWNDQLKNKLELVYIQPFWAVLIPRADLSHHIPDQSVGILKSDWLNWNWRDPCDVLGWYSIGFLCKIMYNCEECIENLNIKVTLTWFIIFMYVWSCM